MSTNKPFVLIPTSELRAKEREVWESYPEDIATLWRAETDEKIAHDKNITLATKKELSQTKTQHRLYHKEGNLFYPSTVEDIQNGLD
jgi:hypothetical protein